MTRARAALLVVALLAAPAPAAAQAWLRWDQSARAMGRGGTAAGAADDAQAAFYDPAGAAWLPGTNVRLDLGAARDGGRFDPFGAPEVDRAPGLAFLGGAYLTHQISRRLTGGLAVNAPWGSRVEWRDAADFPGRFRATAGRIRAVSTSPILAWRIDSRISAAAGLALTYATLGLSRYEQDPDLSALGGAGPIALARTRIDADGIGIGWVAGVHVRPAERVGVGAQVRGRTRIDLDGTANFTDVAPAELRADSLRGEGITIGDRLDATYVDQEVRSRLVLPPLAVVGAVWDPIEPVRLSADVQWTGWSAVDRMPLEFPDPTLSDAVPLDYRDAWAFRVGAEIAHGPTRTIRVGYAHEASPAPAGGVTPLFPDASRDAVSAGLGLAWRETRIDFAWRVAFLADRRGVAWPDGGGAADGVYESVEHRFAVGIARRF